MGLFIRKNFGAFHSKKNLGLFIRKKIWGFLFGKPISDFSLKKFGAFHSEKNLAKFYFAHNFRKLTCQKNLMMGSPPDLGSLIPKTPSDLTSQVCANNYEHVKKGSKKILEGNKVLLGPSAQEKVKKSKIFKNFQKSKIFKISQKNQKNKKLVKF